MRLYGFVSLTDEIDFEMGYVRTASMDANYSFSGTSDTVSVGVDAVGFDYGLRFKPSEELFFKIGMHMLEVDGTISATV